MPSKKDETTRRLLLCINATLQKKAKDVVVLNVKEHSSFTDYMIICSGATERQTKAISTAIQEYLKKSDIRPSGTEGEANGQWILLDYDDIVISIFLEPLRSFYDIENLWDTPRMALPQDTTEVKRLSKGMK